jgi:hypothetical protein
VPEARCNKKIGPFIERADFLLRTRGLIARGARARNEARAFAN